MGFESTKDFLVNILPNSCIVCTVQYSIKGVPKITVFFQRRTAPTKMIRFQNFIHYKTYFELRAFSNGSDRSYTKKIFLEKLLLNFLAHIFTPFLVPFASILVSYSRHSESFKDV